MSKVAIVTGASRGIGREIAKELAKKGIMVIANYFNSEKKAKELQEELKNEGINIDISKADVSKKEECKKIVEYTIKKYKKIDILINNAGVDKVQLITETTKEDWDYMINTNLYSAFAMCQEALPYMIHEKNGCIINISSIWGITGASTEVLYSITKAPGYIETDMNKNYTKEEKEEMKNEIPLERLGMPVDIAKCINWLIEDNYTTGQVISINGGWLI